MNKMLAILVAVCLLLGLGTASYAERYELTVNCMAGGSGGYLLTSPIDFGCHFSSIQSLTLTWSGGGYGSSPSGSYPWWMDAYLKDSVNGNASVNVGHYDTWDGTHGPSFEYLQSSYIGPINFLNDGKAVFCVNIDDTIPSSQPHYTTGGVSEAKLVLFATPGEAPDVPEPSSLIALISGIGTIGGLVIKRRK